jgi:hypothetical protein
MLELILIGLIALLGLGMFAFSIASIALMVYGIYREIVDQKENWVLWIALLLLIPLTEFLWYFLRYRDSGPD